MCLYVSACPYPCLTGFLCKCVCVCHCVCICVAHASLVCVCVCARARTLVCMHVLVCVYEHVCVTVSLTVFRYWMVISVIVINVLLQDAVLFHIWFRLNKIFVIILHAKVKLLNQACTGCRWAHAWGFLKLFMCRGLYVCLCVCLPPTLLMTSGVMWHNVDPIWLVKQVLQLLYGNCNHYCWWVWTWNWYLSYTLTP